MFTDDQSRQSNGQNGFVRRNMTNPRFDGEKTTPSYQSNTDYSPPSTPSYGSGGGYNSRPRQHGGEGGTGGYRGGYTNNRTGGYTNNRTGGYNRNNQTRDSGGSSDRVIRQNDVIIKLLKEIRDRLPPPPAGTQSYDSSSDTAHESYKSESSYHTADAGDYGASDISGGPGNGGGNVSAPPSAAGVNTADEEDKFNS
jgi:hypothetical protein